MSAHDYNSILDQARASLTPAERKKLSRELLQEAPGANDNSPPKSVAYALNELGIIGSISDGPGDLSTNPRYMEGFGSDAR